MYEKIKKEIYQKLPQGIIQQLEIEYMQDCDLFAKLVEIRIRKEKSLILRCFDKDIVLNYVTSGQDVDEILDKISNYSFYSIQEEIINGYVTIEGGHRIGIVGTCVTKNSYIENIKNVSSFNIRIARQVVGCGEEICKAIYSKGFENTLVISEPNIGKTTKIRDITRILSNNKYTITIIDERSEIACMYNGIAQLDVGKRTDVIDKCKKSIGIRIAIRSMSPEIIVVDEIGSNEDICEIKNGILSGVKFLVTAHGNSVEDLQKSNIQELLEQHVFKYVVILKKGSCPEIMEC